MSGVPIVVTNVDTILPHIQQRQRARTILCCSTLPVGNYTVSAERPGFKRAVRSGIRLQVDQRAQVDITLQVGAVAESVEVRSEAPLVIPEVPLSAKLLKTGAWSSCPLMDATH